MVATYGAWPPFDYGRPIDAGHPAFVHLEADERLETELRRGNPCCVLAPFGAGKTSLLLRAQQRLRNAGIVCAYVSLQPLDSQRGDEQTWVESFLEQVHGDLAPPGQDRPAPHRAADAPESPILSPAGRLFESLSALARSVPERTSLPPPPAPGEPTGGGQHSARLRAFARTLGQPPEGANEAPAAQPSGRGLEPGLVLLVDEIGLVLRLGPALRQAFLSTLHNVMRRSLGHVTYAVAGVATLHELGIESVPDVEVKRVGLADFSFKQLASKVPGGERAGNVTEWVRAVYHWTEGHPYMTARLVRELARDREAGAHEASDASRQRYVERLVRKIFAGEGDEGNSLRRLTQARLEDRASKTELASALMTYRRVIAADAPLAVRQSAVLEVLLRVGLVKRTAGGVTARCPAFAAVLFDEAWIERIERGLDRPLRPYVRVWIEKGLLPSSIAYPKVLRLAAKAAPPSEEEQQFLSELRLRFFRDLLLVAASAAVLVFLVSTLRTRNAELASARSEHLKALQGVKAAEDEQRRERERLEREAEEARRRAEQGEAAKAAKAAEEALAKLSELDAASVEVRLGALQRLIDEARVHVSSSTECTPWAELAFRETSESVGFSRGAIADLSRRRAEAERRARDEGERAERSSKRVEELEREAKRTADAASAASAEIARQQAQLRSLEAELQRVTKELHDCSNGRSGGDSPPDGGKRIVPKKKERRGGATNGGASPGSADAATGID
jgi:hypothetical protein